MADSQDTTNCFANTCIRIIDEVIQKTPQIDGDVVICELPYKFDSSFISHTRNMLNHEFDIRKYHDQL